MAGRPEVAPYGITESFANLTVLLLRLKSKNFLIFIIFFVPKREKIMSYRVEGQIIRALAMTISWNSGVDLLFSL